MSWNLMSIMLGVNKFQLLIDRQHFLQKISGVTETQTRFSKNKSTRQDFYTPNHPDTDTKAIYLWLNKILLYLNVELKVNKFILANYTLINIIIQRPFLSKYQTRVTASWTQVTKDVFSWQVLNTLSYWHKN